MHQEIVQRLRRGDREAIKQIYSEAFAYCASFITNNRGDTDQARDYFQEALIVLFNNLRNPDFELTCNVKTYLYSVMRNQWLKKINKDQRGGLKLVVDQEDGKEFVIIAEDEIEQKREKEDMHELVAKAIKLIKEDCRTLIMSFYFQKVDLTSLAEQMGYTYQFIKVKKNRCMDYLKKKVQELQA